MNKLLCLNIHVGEAKCNTNGTNAEKYKKYNNNYNYIKHVGESGVK